MLTGDKDHWEVRELCLDNLCELRTGGAWHSHVGYEQVYGSAQLSHQVKRIHTVSRFEHLITSTLKDPSDVAPNGRLIVHQEDHTLGWPSRRLALLAEQPIDRFQPLLRPHHGFQNGL